MEEPNSIEIPFSIRFRNGVSVTIDLAETVIRDGATVISGSTRNLDLLSYTEFYEPRISRGGLWARVLGVLILLFLANSFFFDVALQNESTGAAAPILTFDLIIIGVGVLYFFLEMLDTMLELGISQSIIRNHFSDIAYHVVIPSNGGKDLEFIVPREDLHKILSLKTGLEQIKAEPPSNNQESSKQSTSDETTSDNLDKVKQLNELLTEGVITQDDFDRKKKELLGL